MKHVLDRRFQRLSIQLSVHELPRSLAQSAETRAAQAFRLGSLSACRSIHACIRSSKVINSELLRSAHHGHRGGRNLDGTICQYTYVSPSAPPDLPPPSLATFPTYGRLMTMRLDDKPGHPALQLDLVTVVEALATLGPTATGKAIAKYKGAIVISLPRTASRPGIKVVPTQDRHATTAPLERSCASIISVVLKITCSDAALQTWWLATGHMLTSQTEPAIRPRTQLRQCTLKQGGAVENV